RFALKTLAKLGVGRDVVMHDLHHDLPAEVRLPGEIDATHAPFTQEPERLISTKEYAANHAKSTTQRIPCISLGNCMSLFGVVRGTREKSLQVQSSSSARNKWSRMSVCASSPDG